MTAAITIFGGVVACVLVIILLGCVLFTVQYIWLYRCHRCPHCGKFMEFKGMKEDDDNGHFTFHCNHCGAWQQIPREEFFRENESKQA